MPVKKRFVVEKVARTRFLVVEYLDDVFSVAWATCRREDHARQIAHALTHADGCPGAAEARA